MNKYFILVFAFSLLFTLGSGAAPSTSLRHEALRENQSLDKKAYRKSILASEAQQANVSSFLKLQDPAPELRNRPWLWTFTFKLQQLQPMGTGEVTGLDYDLQSYGSGLMPSMGFGFLLNPLQTGTLAWATGLVAQAGYMSQKTNLISPHGFTYNDTRLTTTLMSLAWAHRVSFHRLPHFQFVLHPEIGFVNYTQTNIESSVANFSQQNNYWGLGVGVEYALTPKWGVLAQYTHRLAQSEKAANSNIQKNTFEIGTQVTW